MTTKVEHERYIAYRLEAGERPRTFYEYYVSGHGDFPLDMLRHDSCWPASGEDAAKMDWQSWGAPRFAVRSIRMRSYKEPTIGRWSSFGWSPGPHNLESKKASL
jgi:hypothetical protein